jgi:uncharacterized protein (TIGR00251 family)
MERGCVIVRVRVTPKSSIDAIEGVEETAEGPALKVRVRALPSAGEANAAVERLFAKALGIPKSSVAVAAGDKSRVKALKVTGDPREIGARLRTMIGDLELATTQTGKKTSRGVKP